jgi:hypothetical protein
MPIGVYERKKGMKTGKYKRTKKIIEKYRRANLGRKYSSEVNKKKGRPGKNNPNGKGGKYISNDGYVMIYVPQHALCNCRGYAREHRIVFQKKVGRRLERFEIIHHVDGDKLNNKIENLRIMTKEEHDRLHGKKNCSA